jgi:hypothetical protein
VKITKHEQDRERNKNTLQKKSIYIKNTKSDRRRYDLGNNLALVIGLGGLGGRREEQEEGRGNGETCIPNLLC